MELGLVMLTHFFYAFTSMFAIVNPVGGLLTYVSLTEGLSPVEKKAVAFRSNLIALMLAVFFAVSGELVLDFFHVTVDNLRVAGGVLLFMVALDMLHARTSRESVTPEEVRDAFGKEDISVFPLATPLLTGPGAITTVIVLVRTGKSIELKAVTMLAIVITFLVSYLIFRFADRFYRLLGVTASLVITRIMGLLLGAIAVNFIASGVWNIYRAFVQGMP